MDLSKDPAYAWLLGPASETPPQTVRCVRSPEDETERTGDFLRRCSSDQDNFLQEERRYADAVLFGKLEFDSDNVRLAKRRASEMLTHVSIAEEHLRNARVHAEKEMSPAVEREIDGEIEKFAAQLIHLHYLRRELQILRIFIPLANAKLRSQRKIPNMAIEETQRAAREHDNWRQWATSLVTEQPDLRDNKRAIAEELKRRYGIWQSVDTIRKKLL